MGFISLRLNLFDDCSTNRLPSFENFIAVITVVSMEPMVSKVCLNICKGNIAFRKVYWFEARVNIIKGYLLGVSYCSYSAE